MAAITEAKFGCTECPNVDHADRMFIYNNKLLCQDCIKKYTPYPFCSQPSECLAAGSCRRNPNCCE